MPTETNCPNCRQALTVPDAPQGRLAKCAYCGSVFPLAEALAASSDAAAAGGGPPKPLQSTAPGIPRSDAAPAESPESSPSLAEAVEPSRDEEATAAGEYAPTSAPRPATLPGAVPAALPTIGQTPSPSAPVAVGTPSGWHLRIPEGRTYGPVDRAKLDRWLQEGRIDADCFLREGEQGEWLPAATLFPQLRSFGNDQPDVRRQTSLPQTAYAPRTQGAHAPHAQPNPQYAGGDRNAGSYFAGHPVRRTATSDSYSAASPYGGQPNATGSPFRAPHVQPHRGEIVFLLGLFGILMFCPVFSGAAWYLGGSDLKAMNLGLMNPDGRGMTTFGYVLGIVVSCFWIVAALITMLVVSISILTQ